MPTAIELTRISAEKGHVDDQGRCAVREEDHCAEPCHGIRLIDVFVNGTARYTDSTDFSFTNLSWSDPFDLNFTTSVEYDR